MPKDNNKGKSGASVENKLALEENKASEASVTAPRERNNLPIPRPSKPYEPTESVIKEIMVQKGVTHEQAIDILKNPAK